MPRFVVERMMGCVALALLHESPNRDVRSKLVTHHPSHSPSHSHSPPLSLLHSLSSRMRRRKNYMKPVSSTFCWHFDHNAVMIFVSRLMVSSVCLKDSHSGTDSSWRNSETPSVFSQMSSTSSSSDAFSSSLSGNLGPFNSQQSFDSFKATPVNEPATSSMFGFEGLRKPNYSLPTTNDASFLLPPSANVTKAKRAPLKYLNSSLRFSFDSALSNPTASAPVPGQSENEPTPSFMFGNTFGSTPIDLGGKPQNGSVFGSCIGSRSGPAFYPHVTVSQLFHCYQQVILLEERAPPPPTPPPPPSTNTSNTNTL